MHALPFAIALATAAVLAPGLLRTLAASGHSAPNYRERMLPFPFGILIPAAAALALIPVMLIGRLASVGLIHPETLVIALYAFGVIALGLIDDTIGAAPREDGRAAREDGGATAPRSPAASCPPAC